MLRIRYLLVAVSAAALGAALTISALASAPRAVHEHSAAIPARYTAKFLAAARAQLIKDLRRPDTALLVRREGIHAAAMVTSAGSYNWAGYADTSSTAGEFTKVSGSWKVPSVKCTAEDRVTSEWVGLDGFSTSTVEQDGTASQCFKGKAIYYDWYEMYPAGTVEIHTIAAGSSITATVSRSGSSYTLKLTDSTNTADSFKKTATCATTTCLDESAEWIVERPAYSTTGIVPEAQFTTVKFTRGSAVAAGKTVTIGKGPSPYVLKCVDSTQTYNIVSTGSLSGGNAFTSTWKNSY
jgi:Peptidase A4 family